MKRVIVALVLLLVVVGLCTGAIWVQREQSGYLIERLDEMERNFDREHPEDSLEDARRFVQEFEEHTKLFPAFVRHSDLSRIQEDIHSLPVLLESGEPADFTPTLARCRARLQILYSQELPSLENIF